MVELTRFRVGERVFMARTAQVRALRRRDRLVEIETHDLRAWLGLAGGPGTMAIIVRRATAHIALLVDTVEQLAAETLPLPPLVHVVGAHPAITGVVMTDEELALLVDLAVLVHQLAPPQA